MTTFDVTPTEPADTTWRTLGTTVHLLVTDPGRLELVRRAVVPVLVDVDATYCRAAWPLALFHGIGTGTSAAAPWMIAVNLASLAVVGSAVLVRVLYAGSQAPATPIMAGMQPSPGAVARGPSNPAARL